MSAEHHCDGCGKKMKRTAKCEFYCESCDRTIFDWSLQHEETEQKREHRSDFDLADFCHGGDLTED